MNLLDIALKLCTSYTQDMSAGSFFCLHKGAFRTVYCVALTIRKMVLQMKGKEDGDKAWSGVSSRYSGESPSQELFPFPHNRSTSDRDQLESEDEAPADADGEEHSGALPCKQELHVIVDRFESNILPFSFLLPGVSQRLKGLKRKLIRMSQNRFEQMYKKALN